MLNRVFFKASRNKLKLVEQVFSNDCGLACLAMLGNYHGVPLQLSSLRKEAHLDQMGMSLFDLSQLARANQLEPMALQMSLEDLLDQDAKLVMPAILHWEEHHFVVLAQLTKSHVWLYDPKLGKQRIPIDSFKEKWYGRGNNRGSLLLVQYNGQHASEHTIRQTGLNGLIDLIKQHLAPNKMVLLNLVWSILLLLGIQLILPFLMQSFIDLGVEHNDMGTVGLVMTGFLVFSISSLVLQWFQNWILLFVGTRLKVGMVHDFIASISKLSTNFLEHNFPADLMQRFGDHIRIETFLRELSIKGVLMVAGLLGFGIILCIYQPILMLIFMVFSLISTGIIIVQLPKRKLLDTASFNLSAHEQEMIWEYVSHVESVKRSAQLSTLQEKWMEIQAEHLSLDKKQLLLGVRQHGVAEAIQVLRDVIVTVIAAQFVIEGSLSLGSLVAIQFIAAQLNVSFQHVPALISSGQDAWISMERIEAVRDLSEATNIGQDITAIEAIQVRDLNFDYGASSFGLNNISLDLNKGKILALAGVSGSGKTSLLKLLAKKYENYSGHILINKHLALSAIKSSSYWSKVAYAHADEPIFSMSLVDNICFGNGVDIDWVKSCLQMTELIAWVEHLPKGLQTPLGAQGINLSLGQHQRIILARMIYAKPEVLLLDEIPNALSDAQTIRILAQIKTVFPDIQICMSTHDRQLLKWSDEVIFLHEGQQVDTGPFDQLFQSSIPFRNLFSE